MADLEAGFESLPIPPLDDQFLSSDDNVALGDLLADPGLGLGLGLEFDENWGCEFTFDDIGDIFVSSEADGFLNPDGSENADSAPKSPSPESGSSAISGIGEYDVSGFLNSPESADRKSNSGGDMNCDQEVSVGPASSHGSGNCGSGVLEGDNSPVNSPSSDRDVSSSVFVGQKVKSEAIGKSNCVPKRKKEAEEEGNSELRTPKYRRSSESGGHELSSGSPIDEEDEKRKARLMRNRESAQLSRQRKKHYVEELEDKVRNMNSTITDLNSRISYIMAENATLRQQLSGGGGMCPPPPPGMYPHPAMGPMAYPWVPCAPYVVKPQGSQVPLVPIPRLKPQHTAPTSKIKKSESKKSESGKSKKVASISFLGLLFFVLLFGGLVPIVNVRFGGFDDKFPGGSGYVSGRLYDQHRGRVLTVDDGSSRVGETVGIGLNRKEKRSHDLPGSDEFPSLGNGSEPLVASLYVPRNDKMVKIDGNLIIHSVLATEKTKASLERLEMKRNMETQLAIARNIPPSYTVPEAGANSGRRIPLCGNSAERPKALSSGAADAMKDRMKSSAADVRLQQWFREGLAGPMLSSGMCTEVFQFDVSPASTSGAIVPASSVPKVSAKQGQNNTQNSTHTSERRNRRTLHRLPVPLPNATYNITDEHVNRSSQNGDFQGNRSVSSMVVSVLVDPRETADGDIDGVIKPKSLSRIFVVVLIDSVKYVTYSCVLPRAAPHLVTA